MSVVPQVTKQDVLDAIKSVKYFYDGLLTVAIVTTVSGVKHTGESVCASELKYNKEMGEKLALDMATSKVWHHLGILLKEKLALIDSVGAPTGEILNLGSPVTYVGTNVIHAVPMDRQAYNDLRGWQLPKDENGEDLGYLVQATQGSPLQTLKGFSGYISWSPREVFERTYTTGVRQ